jgi:hypothetical protein
MTIPPESIEVGKCYLMETGHVRQVRRVLPDGRVQYEHRPGHQINVGAWRPGIQQIHSFAFLVEREVACDWTPEKDGPSTTS